MQTPLYFDSHTSYLPFAEVETLLRKPRDPHASSYFFASRDKSQTIKGLLHDVYNLLGLQENKGFRLFSEYVFAAREMVLLHYREEILPSGKQHVLVFKDRTSLCDVWRQYACFGVVLEEIEPQQELVTVEVLKKYITSRTTFVSIPWANPLTGVVQPVMELAKYCKERNIAFHTDISYVVGKKYISLKDFDFTYVTCEAKAFHGPAETSFLITPKNEGFEESSFYSLPALKEALYQAFERIDDYHLEIVRMKKLFEKILIQELGDEVRILSKNTETLPHVALLEFPLCMNQVLLHYLAKDKLYASCGEKDLCFLDQILTFRGKSANEAKSALSFFFPYNITQDLVVEATTRIKRQYEKAKLFAKDL